MRQITEALFSMQDEKYRAFHGALMPTVERERIIGVRMPALRRYAAALFLLDLPHTYYEENNLHALLLMREKDFDVLMPQLERFLPEIDNWATCDLFKPACFAQNRKGLLPYLSEWLRSDRPYTVRFAIEMLMTHYLREDFSPEYPAWVAAVSSKHYYVRMMQAWYFATALAFRYEELLPYLTQERLSPWVRQKTIQKAVESFRLSPAQKEELKALRREAPPRNTSCSG